MQQNPPPYRETAGQDDPNILTLTRSQSSSSRRSMDSISPGGRPSNRVPPPVPPKRAMSVQIGSVLPARPGSDQGWELVARPAVSQPSPRTKYAILVMGATGAGKSSFIAAATGKSVRVGHSLDPCTTDPEDFEMISRDGTAVTLIDTPGFNDLRRSDMDVLESIIAHIATTPRQKILAVIYIHRIIDKKITGSTKINLRILRAVCGEHFAQNLVLVTSMWSSVPSSAQEATAAREAELNTSPEFWADMFHKGATYARWDENKTGHFLSDIHSAREVIEHKLLERRTSGGGGGNLPKPQILLELEKGAAIEDTSAGRVLTEELRKRQEKERKRLEEEEEETRLLEQEAKETQARLRKAREELQVEAELAAARQRHQRAERERAERERPRSRIYDAPSTEVILVRERRSSLGSRSSGRPVEATVQYEQRRPPGRERRERDRRHDADFESETDEVEERPRRPHTTRRHTEKRKALQILEYFRT